MNPFRIHPHLRNPFGIRPHLYPLPEGEGWGGWETSYDVILERRLRPALQKLNPDLPEEALNLAVEELAKDRGLMSLVLDS